MKREIKVGNKEELKEAILSCKKAKCDTLIILNGQTEYLIYNPSALMRTGILFCETDKAFFSSDKKYQQETINEIRYMLPEFKKYAHELFNKFRKKWLAL